METPFLGEPGERPRRRSSDTKECAHCKVVPGTIRKTRRPLFVDRDIQSPVGDAPAESFRVSSHNEVKYRLQEVRRAPGWQFGDGASRWMHNLDSSL
jgi:hypothetical protein